MPPNADHEELKVQEALQLMKENPEMTAAEAARQTRAPYERLRRRRRGVPASSSRGGQNKKLGEPETRALREHLLMCHALGKSASIDIVIASANSVLRCIGSDKTVSRRWTKRWIISQKDFLKTLRSKPLSFERRASHIKEDIETHFSEFDRCRRKWGIQDDDIYNFDETGCQIGIGTEGIVIVPVNTEAVFIDDPDNRELVTSTECISATEYHVPPMVIFKGAYHLRKYVDNDMSGDTFFGRSESGFTNDKLTLAWLKYFHMFTEKRTKGRYRMLIFDGYGLHVTQDFIDYCWEHCIRLFQLPAHSTHLLQPLDVGVFQSFKYNFKKALREEVFLGATEMTKIDFFSFFQRFSDKTFTTKTCISAFQKTGFIPFKPSVVLDKMKAMGGIQEETTARARSKELLFSSDSESVFATPPPPDWIQFNTPITNTQRRRGSEYVRARATIGLLTPTAIHVMDKVEKGSN
jgi:hypothetical protein